MATQRFISRTGGNLTDTVPVIASTGTANSGQIPALNASGNIDASMLPGRCIYFPVITTTLTVTSLAVNGSSTFTVTVNGAVVGTHGVFISPMADPGAGFSYQAWVSAANTVTIRVVNSAGTVTASTSFKAIVGLVSVS